MRVWPIVIVAWLAVACGGSDTDTVEADTAADEPTATLGIISTKIETAIDGAGFTPATEGQTLTTGDQVRTDPTGFAELTYHDGSWTRIENNATLTIDTLTDTGDTKTVSASIDTGDAWNRVRDLTTPEDAYELDTPVATAAVRGTAFAAQCANPTTCTFSVVDGEVLITPKVGDPLTLTAGQQITITADQNPPPPTEPGVNTLTQDPFIATNLKLDNDKTTNTTPDTQPDTQEDDLESFDGTWSTTATNPRLLDARGTYTDAAVELSGADLRVGGGIPGAPEGTSGLGPLADSQVELSCNSDECTLPPGLALVRRGDALTVVSEATGSPVTAICGFPDPGEAWRVEVVSPNEFRFTFATEGGFGGEDGCLNAYQALVDITLTRS